MSQTIEFEWMEDEGRHRVKVKTKKEDVYFIRRKRSLLSPFLIWSSST